MSSNTTYMANVGENFETRLVELLLNSIKKEYGGYQKLETELPQDPVIPLLDIYPKETSMLKRCLQSC